MADATNQTPQVTSSNSTTQTSGTTSTPSAPTGTSTYDSKTRVTSLADLRQKAPKVWNAINMGIAQNICTDMQHRSEHLKELIREGERNS